MSESLLGHTALGEAAGVESPVKPATYYKGGSVRFHKKELLLGGETFLLGTRSENSWNQVCAALCLSEVCSFLIHGYPSEFLRCVIKVMQNT